MNITFPWSKKEHVEAETPKLVMSDLETAILASLEAEPEQWELRGFPGNGSTGFTLARHRKTGTSISAQWHNGPVTCDRLTFGLGFSERWNEVVEARAEAKRLQEAEEQRQKVELALRTAFL